MEEDKEKTRRFIQGTRVKEANYDMAVNDEDLDCRLDDSSEDLWEVVDKIEAAANRLGLKLDTGGKSQGASGEREPSHARQGNRIGQPKSGAEKVVWICR
jgi:hypothetical protein